MRIKCIDAGSTYGTGKGLLTEGKIYNTNRKHGGYYVVTCDDGKEYTKSTHRFIVRSLYDVKRD